MTVNNPPYALQNASHSAALFRQAASSMIQFGSTLQPNECQVAQTGTPSMAVTVAAGRAWIPGTSVSNVMNNWSTQGMYFTLNDATVTLTIAASDPVNPRIDLVYYQIQDAFYSGSSNVGVLGVVTGTPAPSPSAPATPSNAIPLATVAVAASATSIVNANISNVSAPLVRVPSIAQSSSGYPASPEKGTILFDATVGHTMEWNGTSWRPLTATVFGAASPMAGSTPPAGTVGLIQAGTATVTTNASAIGQFAWPVSFPNGLLGVSLTTLTDTITQLRLVFGSTSTTLCQFVARTDTGAGAPSTSVGVSFIAFGW